MQCGICYGYNVEDVNRKYLGDNVQNAQCEIYYEGRVEDVK